MDNGLWIRLNPFRPLIIRRVGLQVIEMAGFILAFRE